MDMVPLSLTMETICKDSSPMDDAKVRADTSNLTEVIMRVI